MIRFIKNQRGTVSIMMALMLILLCGMVGLAVDLGYLAYHKQNVQNGMDLVVLAACQEIGNDPDRVESVAKEFATKNGLSAADVTVIYPYEGDFTKVKVLISSNYKFFFLPIIGYSQTTVAAQGVAKVESYTIFTESKTEDLVINSAGTINGDIHSNSNITLQSTKLKVKGRVEAVGSITNKATVSSMKQGAAYKELVQLVMDEYRDDDDDEDLEIKFSTELDADEIIYVDGNIKIFSRVSGGGKIIATGDIEFVGNDIEFGTPDDEIMFYAGGDIKFSGTRGNYGGIFYAPNGAINLPCSNSTINGRLYSDTLRITGNDNDIIPTNYLLPEMSYVCIIE